MQRKPLRSTALAGIGYDAANQRLELEFTDGRVYQYLGVSQQVHAELLASESKGQYFNASIRHRFPHCIVAH